jgi:hypothetical protein
MYSYTPFLDRMLDRKRKFQFFLPTKKKLQYICQLVLVVTCHMIMCTFSFIAGGFMSPCDAKFAVLLLVIEAYCHQLMLVIITGSLSRVLVASVLFFKKVACNGPLFIFRRFELVDMRECPDVYQLVLLPDTERPVDSNLNPIRSGHASHGPYHCVSSFHLPLVTYLR